MATIDLNDVLRVVARWDAPDSTIAELVWHYQVIAGTGGSPATILAAILTALDASWLNIDQDVSDEWTGDTLELFKYDFANHQWDGVAADLMLAEDGTAAGTYLAHGDSLLIKFFTQANRRQGRKYMFGLTEAAITDGVWDVAELSNFALFGADFDDNVVSGAITLQFGTFNVDDTSALYETFSANIQTAQAENLPAYQRRRRPGTGV